MGVVRMGSKPVAAVASGDEPRTRRGCTAGGRSSRPRRRPPGPGALAAIADATTPDVLPWSLGRADRRVALDVLDARSSPASEGSPQVAPRSTSRCEVARSGSPRRPGASRVRRVATEPAAGGARPPRGPRRATAADAPYRPRRTAERRARTPAIAGVEAERAAGLGPEAATSGFQPPDTSSRSGLDAATDRCRRAGRP